MPAETSSSDRIPDAPAQRKPPRRLWLFLPFILIAVLAVGYSAFWYAASQRLSSEVDARAATLRDAGYVVDLSGRRVSGFPFRMKLAFAEARIASPSGWALAVPGFEAEAYLHDLGHWVAVAPQGLTFTRPEGGPVTLRGASLRASIAGVDQAPWRVVLQARKAVFTPGAGARPFSLATADLVEFYLRPSPKAGEGMVLFRVEGGKGMAGSLLGQIAGDGAVTAALEGRVTHPAAFNGGDWGRSVQSWSRAGGVINAVQGTAAAGAFSAKAQGGTLGVGPDGRLVGALPLELRQAGRALAALANSQTVEAGAAGNAAAVAAARAQGEATTINLVFQAGVMTLGPVRVGPSPKVG